MRKTTERINFTKKTLEALSTNGTRATYYDEQVRDLGLLVQPSGRKSFFWFRKIDGTAKWKTIGPFPDLSIENARAKAQEYNSAIARWKADDYEGPAPFARHARSVTLGEILDKYIDGHVKKNAKNPDRAVKHTRWQFNRYLSGWKERKLNTIRREDVRELHTEIGKRQGKAGPGAKNCHYTANRVVALVRVLFNWAIDEENWQGANPARSHRGKKNRLRFTEHKRRRRIQGDEFPRFFRTLSTEKNFNFRDFVFLAIFTGARRADLLAMRWDQLDFHHSRWDIPRPKNNMPYVVPLIPLVVGVLKARRRRITKGEWVFPSSSKSGYVRDMRRAWGKFLKRAKITDLRVHDLRRTLGSEQADAGASLPTIGKTLGHEAGSPATQIYVQLQTEPVREAINEATRAMLAAGKVTRQKLLAAPRG